MPPCDICLVHKIEQGVVVRTRGLELRFGARGINLIDVLPHWRCATRVIARSDDALRILCHEQITARRRRRRTRNNELMRGKTWPLVGLEQAAGERVLL